MVCQKSEKQWAGADCCDYADVFLNSIGGYKKEFIDFLESEHCELDSTKQGCFRDNFQWQSSSKGSIYHYAKFFPNDGRLNSMCSLFHRKINGSGRMV